MTADTPADRMFREFQIQKFDLQRMVPAVTMTVEADVTRLMQLRATLNARRSQAEHVTVTHLVNKAACEVLTDFPVLYASFNGTRIIANSELVLNVPVDIENHVEYLVIHRPNTKSLDEFVAESAAELARIRRGEGEFRKYVQSLMRLPVWARRLALNVPGQDIRILRTYYGNFPISNFGSFGVDRGQLAISRPMIAALCFGKIQDRLISLPPESYAAAKELSLSLTFDHRAVDGAYAGRYLSALKQRLEGADRLLGTPE